MDVVVSADGTPIACHRRGSGPPLVLVHGTGGANPVVAWVGVIPSLAAQFAVIAPDRRGRGESGDGPVYDIEREYEDIVAVINAQNEPVALFGHSFGGLIALEACLRTANVSRLILYEPSIALPEEGDETEELTGRLEALLEAGDREGLYLTFLREIVQMSEEEIDQVRSSPLWPARLASVHTLPREMRVEAAGAFNPRRFASMAVPTLLLVGEESPEVFQAGVRALRAALPNSRTAVLPGQQHIAMYTAPDLFLRAVLPFLEGAAEEA